MNKKRIALRAVLIAVIGISIGLAVYSWNARRVVGNSMPMPFGIGVSVVLSGSMEPELSVNDLVVVKSADEYEIGDIVVYQSGNDLIIHRIIAINDEEEKITTKGDANNVEDAEISISAVKGKLSFSLPFVGLIVRGLKTVPGTLIVILGSLFLMNLSWRKEKEEADSDIDRIKEEIRRLKAEQTAGAEDKKED